MKTTSATEILASRYCNRDPAVSYPPCVRTPHEQFIYDKGYLAGEKHASAVQLGKVKSDRKSMAARSNGNKPCADGKKRGRPKRAI